MFCVSLQFGLANECRFVLVFVDTNKTYNMNCLLESPCNTRGDYDDRPCCMADIELVRNRTQTKKLDLCGRIFYVRRSCSCEQYVMHLCIVC